jgi:hypothetical protein
LLDKNPSKENEKMAYKMAKNVLIKYISSVEGAENDDE